MLSDHETVKHKLQCGALFVVSSYLVQYWTKNDAVVLLLGHQTCDLQVLAGHHCVVALGKLPTPVCLCHEAV